MNIFKLASGDVRGLLTQRPFLTGEVFTQTNDSQDLGDKYLIDAATGAQITNLYAGDIYGGTGEYYTDTTEHPKVWQLGSGNALKFANKFITAWGSNVKTELKSHPNWVYIYVGEGTSFDKSATKVGEVVDWKSYVATNPTEGKPYIDAGDAGDWSRNNKLGDDHFDVAFGDAYGEKETAKDYLNSGDLVFYSPIMKQFIAIHLSRSQDSLVKLQVADFVSKSMRGKLGTTDTVTLQDFFNGELRNYQYFDENGWSPVGITVTEDSTGKVSVSKLIMPKDDGDGYIHYVPFTYELQADGSQPVTLIPGKDYTIDLKTGELSPAGFEVTTSVKVKAGDLILSVPVAKTEKGYAIVKHVVVSLYGKYFEDFANFTIARADAYAGERWSKKDEAFLKDLLDETTHGNITVELLKNLYETKVDIDPVTKKIVTSQLPDFVLGAMKYVGSTSILNSFFYEEDTLKNPLPTAKDLLAELFIAKNTKDTDISEADLNKPSVEDAPNTTLDADYDDWLSKTDTAALVGNYWIYTGNTFEYGAEFKNIFSNAEADGTEVPGDENTTSENLVHELHSGDYIIWNGTNFDVIDNTDSLVGIRFYANDGTSYTIQGVADVTTSKRAIKENVGYEKGGAAKSSSVKAANVITTSNPTANNGVQLDANAVALFALQEANGESTPTIADTYIPFVNADGVIYSSRFKFVNNGTETEGVVSVLNFEKSETANVKLNFDTKAATATAEYVFGNSDVGDVGKLTNKKFVHRFLADDFDSTVEDISNALNKSDAPELSLPNYDGTLTTEAYVDAGFQCIEEYLDELYDNLANGTEDWLRTIVDVRDEDGKLLGYKKVIDSHVKQQLIAAAAPGASATAVDEITLVLNPDEANFVGKENEHSKKVPNNLTVLADLTGELETGTLSTEAPNWHKLLKETNKKLDLSDVQEILKLALNTEAVRNYLPNHGGILLNSNSVIDCGVYTYTGN